MPTSPLRHDEADSLHALLRLEVLDTPPDAEFDALAQAAAKVCDMPAALVSLIDVDRQWVKARFGFDGPLGIPRSLSFCAHAVVGDVLFEVEDASCDPRFADHPYVVGAPHIRFYAGAPLRLGCGARIGTLCVIDKVPRRLSPAQRAALHRLSLAVVRALEDRGADLRRSAEGAAAAPAVSSHHLELALQNVDSAMQELLLGPRAMARVASPATVRARLRAMRLCLTSTMALLGITSRLSAPEAVQTNEDRVKASQQLVDQTKVAGRAAYRAALMLTDPQLDDEIEQVG
jgi:hypothetical protein